MKKPRNNRTQRNWRIASEAQRYRQRHRWNEETILPLSHTMYILHDNYTLLPCFVLPRRVVFMPVYLVLYTAAMSPRVSTNYHETKKKKKKRKRKSFLMNCASSYIFTTISASVCTGYAHLPLCIWNKSLFTRGSNYLYLHLLSLSPPSNESARGKVSNCFLFSRFILSLLPL